MKAIIAVNNLGFIGKGNTLLWKNKEDLQTEYDKTTFLSMGERCIILNGDSADIIKEILYQQRLDIENAI